MQGDEKQPSAPLANNFRPPQPLHHRPVRTNIDFNVQVRRNSASNKFISNHKENDRANLIILRV